MLVFGILAHAHKVEERNWELRHISHSLFSKMWNTYARPVQITVWLGDLNYRIQGIDNHPARNLIRKDLHSVNFLSVTLFCSFLNYYMQQNKYQKFNYIYVNCMQQLTSKDQLLMEAEKGQIFKGYCEGTLTFKPTYKYNIGTSNYDTSYKVYYYLIFIIFYIHVIDNIAKLALIYYSNCFLNK